MTLLMDLIPLPIAPTLAIAGITAALLFGVWMQTGRNLFIGIAGGVIVLAAALLLLTRMITTERQRIENTLHEIARHVERGDFDKIDDYVYSGAPEIARRAKAELPRYEIEVVEIKTSTLRIDIDESVSPPRAVARFNVIVVLGGDRDSDPFSGRRYPRYVEVVMRKEDGRWRVENYSHDDPRRGLQR